MTTKTKTTGKREQVIRRTVYTARHLKRYYPEGFQRAYARYCDNVSQDTYRMYEILDSLKGLFDAAGVRMKNWEIGAYSHSFIRAEFPVPGYAYDDSEGTAELRGARAFAWIENNLLAQYRAPWGLPKLKPGAPLPDGYTRSWEAPSKKHPHGVLHTTEIQPVTRWTRPGALKECPFTGVCYDEDFIDALLKSITAGETLGEAFEGLANVARDLIEKEDEYEREETSFLDAADANEWEYTKDGRRV